MKKIVLPRWFRDISIAHKLYFVVGVMALLIAMELIVLVFSINTLSAVRALVGAEGLWSKGQKDALYNLRKYTRSGDEADYKAYLHFLKVPLADDVVRMELGKENPDLKIARRGFIDAGNHPDDVDGMVKLLTRFSHISYLKKAIDAWTEASLKMKDLQKTGDELHSLRMASGSSVKEKLELNLRQIDKYNEEFTILENNFSSALGEGSRWLEGLILKILLAIALTVEVSGLLLAVIISVNISKGIGQILWASNQISLGNYVAKAIVYSQDEIGQLATSFNEMSGQLEQNISERKQAAQYTYTRSLIEAGLDPLIAINGEGEITDMNEALVRVMRKHREDLLGTDFFIYFSEPEKARQFYKEVFAAGSVVDFPLTICDEIGKVTKVLFNGSVYKNERGTVIGALLVARDITEQKRVESYLIQSIKEIRDYKYALDESSIVAITDQDGIIQYANDNFCHISKYARVELIGQDLRIFNSGDHDKEFISDLWTTIASGSIWRGELKYKAKDRTIYWVDTTIVPFLNEKGKPYQYIGISADITARKRIEAELLVATAKAQTATTAAVDAMKAKQQFLSNMSHEIRTPMNSIIGFTKVILRTDLGPKQKEYLQAIKISGDALIVLVDDILDLAKVESGKMTFEQTPFKPALLLSSILHMFESKIQKKQLELIKRYDNKIPEVLLGDSARLNQIVLNLLSNAIKFTEKGKIIVSVSLLHEDDREVQIEFAIADTGIGIPENMLESIFDNFQQASDNTLRLYGGTGLGLAIVKQLVEYQGGTIGLKSKIGEGSTFSFKLNFQKTDREAGVEAPMLELNREIKNIRVLAVEDSVLNQLLIKTLMDYFGFEHDIVSNGNMAIEKLQSQSYDIILMDLQMPELNGYDTTEYIRNKMNLKVPVIALTANVDADVVAKCKAAGMTDYIAKPIDERLLYSKIVGLVKKQWN